MNAPICQVCSGAHKTRECDGQSPEKCPKCGGPHMRTSCTQFPKPRFRRKVTQAPRPQSYQPQPGRSVSFQEEFSEQPSVIRDDRPKYSAVADGSFKLAQLESRIDRNAQLIEQQSAKFNLCMGRIESMFTSVMQKFNPSDRLIQNRRTPALLGPPVSTDAMPKPLPIFRDNSVQTDTNRLGVADRSAGDTQRVVHRPSAFSSSPKRPKRYSTREYRSPVPPPNFRPIQSYGKPPNLRLNHSSRLQNDREDIIRRLRVLRDELSAAYDDFYRMGEHRLATDINQIQRDVGWALSGINMLTSTQLHTSLQSASLFLEQLKNSR